MSRPLTQRDVMLAILALDAYSRGPDRKRAIEGLAEVVGSADVINESSKDLPDSIESGFGAVAYTYDGGTVISYRGTDFDLNEVKNWWDNLEFSTASLEDFPELFRDILGGWLSSFNVLGTDIEFAGFEIANLQPKYADDFYELVAKQSVVPPQPDGVGNTPQRAEITITGHSLRGGLTG